MSVANADAYNIRYFYIKEKNGRLYCIKSRYGTSKKPSETTLNYIMFNK